MSKENQRMQLEKKGEKWQTDKYGNEGKMEGSKTLIKEIHNTRHT